MHRFATWSLVGLSLILVSPGLCAELEKCNTSCGQRYEIQRHLTPWSKKICYTCSSVCPEQFPQCVTECTKQPVEHEYDYRRTEIVVFDYIGCEVEGTKSCAEMKFTKALSKQIWEVTNYCIAKQCCPGGGFCKPDVGEESRTLVDQEMKADQCVCGEQ